MRVRSFVVRVGFVTAYSTVAVLAEEALPDLKGPYFGQQPPGQEAELFAPGFASRFEAGAELPPLVRVIRTQVVRGERAKPGRD